MGIPNKVVPATACLVRLVPPGQGIADEVAARRKAESKVAKRFPPKLRRQIWLVDETAPGNIAGITRDDLGRLEGAHRRAETVGSDDEVRIDRSAVGEVCSNASHTPGDANQLPALMIVLAWKCRAKGIEDKAPGGEILRIGIARDDRAKPIIRRAPRHLYSDAALCNDPCGSHDRDHRSVLRNSCATRGQLFGDTLENVHMPASTHQHVSEEEAAYRPSDNDQSRLGEASHALHLKGRIR